jgi:hypothetical protein
MPVQWWANGLVILKRCGSEEPRAQFGARLQVGLSLSFIAQGYLVYCIVSVDATKEMAMCLWLSWNLMPGHYGGVPLLSLLTWESTYR